MAASLGVQTKNHLVIKRESFHKKAKVQVTSGLKVPTMQAIQTAKKDSM